MARAIYNSEIPIISAVGHETDFTIADFVADLRAPTPSAAAELANPDVYELKNKIFTYRQRSRLSLKKKLELMKLQYEKISSSVALTDSYRKINDYSIQLDKFVKSLDGSIKQKEQEAKMQLTGIVSRLDALSPLKTLTRGYSITEKDGKIVKSKKDLNKDDEVRIRFFDGEKQAKIM